MPIDPASVQWDSAPSTSGDGSQSPRGAPDPSQVQWDPPSSAIKPGSASAAAMTHTAPNSHQSMAQMLYPEVDFDSGLPFLDRTHLAQADNFQEKKNYLEKVYGKKNVEVDSDPYGAPMLVVTKDGKKIAADGGSGFGQFTADIVGSGPEWLGMAAGGALGAPLGPAGIVGGAALGAGIGKEATQIQKMGEGTFQQTPKEAAGNALTAVEGGAMGELGGKLTSSMVSRVLRGRLPELITQTDSGTDAMTDRTLAGGARPPASSTMPGAKKIQWTEALARKTVSGVRSQDEANADYVADRMRKILRDAGLPDAHIEPTLHELETGDAKIPTEEIGEHVKSRVQAHQEMLDKNVQDRLTAVNTELDKKLKHLDTLTQRFAPGELGVDVASGIRQARADFGTSMSKIYDKVDSLVGEQKLVPVELIQREAARIARRMPKSAQAGVTRELAGLPQPNSAAPEDQALWESLGIKPPEAENGKITFADAQRLRTMLREKSDEASLTRGMTQGEMATLANAVDYSIQQAAKDPAATQAVKLLNAADKAYAQGIRRFNDATAKRLVKNLQAGLSPDPEEIARQIVQPGQEARVKEIRKLVGENAWKRVAGADYARMLRSSTTPTGEIDGTRLLSEVRQRRQLLSVVYGDQLSGQIEELARTMAARDGVLPAEALAPGRMRQTLESLHEAQASEDRFMKESYLGLLGNPRRNPEQVYRWLVKPDNAAALRQAIDLMGEDSHQVAGLRQAALKELLVNAKMNFADGRAGDALSKALSQYTPEQQKLLFPKGMDSDLHLLGKEIEFVMRTHTDESKASFAAGAVLAQPFFTRVPIQVGIGLYQTLLSQPQVIRYLALGLRQPPGPARIAARAMVENLVRYGAISPTVNSDQGAPTNEKGDTTLTGAGAGP